MNTNFRILGIGVPNAKKDMVVVYTTPIFAWDDPMVESVALHINLTTINTIKSMYFNSFSVDGFKSSFDRKVILINNEKIYSKDIISHDITRYFYLKRKRDLNLFDGLITTDGSKLNKPTLPYNQNIGELEWITKEHVDMLKRFRPDMLPFLPAYAQLFLV